jgi:hypothetical protein
LLDDLVADHISFYRRITAFLGVDFQPISANVVFNAARSNRSPKLARFLRWSHLLRNSRVSRLAPVLGKLGLHPLRFLRLANAIPHVHREIAPSFRSELYGAFEKEVDTLEALLGRSLERWRLKQTDVDV